MEQDAKLPVARDSAGQLLTPNTKYKLSFYLKITGRDTYDVQYYENGVYYDTTKPTTPTICTPGDTNKNTCKLACDKPTTGVANSNGLNPFNCTLTNGFGEPYPFKASSNYPHAAYSPFSGDYDILIRDPNQYELSSANSESYYKSVLPSRFLQATVKYKDQDWFYNNYEFTTLNNTTTIDIMIKQMGFTGNLIIDDMHLEKINTFVSDADMVTPVNFPGVMSIDTAKSTPDTGGSAVSNPTFASNAAKFSFGTTNLKFAHKDDLTKFLSTLTFPANYLSGLAVTDAAQGVKVYENANVRIAAAADSTAIIKLKKDMSINLTGIPAAYSFYRNGLLFLRDVGTKPLPDGSMDPYGNGIFFTPVLSDGDLNQFYWKVKNKLGNVLDLVEKGYRLSNWNVVDGAGAIVGGWEATNIVEYDRVLLPDLRKWTEPTAAQFTNGTWNIAYNGKAGDAYLMSVFPPKEFDYEKFCNEAAAYASGITYPADTSQTNLLSWWNKSKQKLAALSNRVNIINLWDYYYKCSDGNCPNIEDTNYSYDLDLEKHSNGTNTTLLQRYEASYGPDWKYDLQWPKELNSSAPWFQNIQEIRSKLGLKDLVYKSPQYHLNFSDTSFIDSYSDHLNLKDGDNNYLIDGTYLDGPRNKDVIENLVLFRGLRNKISDASGRDKNGMMLLHSSGNTWFFDNRAGEDNGKFIDGARFRMPFIDAYADLIWTGESLPFTSNEIWLNNYTNFGISNTNTQLLMENKTNQEGSNPPMSNTEQTVKQLNSFGLARPIMSWPNYYEGWVKDDVDANDDINVFNLNTYYQKWQQICAPITKNNNKCDFQESYKNPNDDRAGKNDCAPKDTQEPNLTIRDGNITESKSEKTIANWLIDNNPLFKLHYSLDDITSIFTDSSGNKLDANIGGSSDNTFPTYETINGRKYAVFNGLSRLAGFHGSLLNSDGASPQDKIPTLDLTNKDFSIFGLVKKENRNDGRDHAIYVQDKTRRKITCQETIPPTPSNCDLPYCTNSLTTGCIPSDQINKIYISNYVQELTPSVYLGINDTSTQDKVIVKIKKTDNTPFVCTSSQSIDENWHMIGFTFEKVSRTIKIYIDGVADSSNCVLPSAGLFDDTLFSIGSLTKASLAETRQGFHGNIDDIFVSDSLFSQEQIQALYGDGSTSYLKKISLLNNQLDLPIRAVLSSGFRQYQSSTPTVTTKADRSSARSEDIITYTLTYQNYSEEQLTLSNLSSPISPGTTFVSDSSTGLIIRTDNTTRNINRNFNVPDQILTWIFDQSHPGTLKPGEKFIGTYQVKVN